MVTRLMQGFTCCTGWVKREGMHSEESRICDGFLKGMCSCVLSEKILSWNPESEIYIVNSRDFLPSFC